MHLVTSTTETRATFSVAKWISEVHTVLHNHYVAVSMSGSVADISQVKLHVELQES